MKRIRIMLTVLLSVLSLLYGCAAKPSAHTGTLFAMDTVMEWTVYGEEDLQTEITDLIRQMERTLSVTDPESDLYRLNHGLSDRTGSDTAELLTRTLELSRRTGGALDPTVYPLVRAWGFTTGINRVPSDEELSELLARVDYSAVRVEDGRVILPDGAELDLGGVAKGDLGAKLADLCRQKGISGAIFNLGGNVQTVGTKPDGSSWKIAIADPADPHGNSYAGILSVGACAVVTSGGYERFFEQDGKTYHHIMDPKTGSPANSGLCSVTVVGQDGLVCDALSTALYVMGLERATDLWRSSWDFEAIFITEEGSIYLTEGIAEQFTPGESYRDAKVTVIER